MENPDTKPVPVIVSAGSGDATMSLVLCELQQSGKTVLPVRLHGVPDPAWQGFETPRTLFE